MNKVKVGDLKIGDKFRYGQYGRPYLVVDIDFKNCSLFMDYSNLTAVLDLVTYKLIGFNNETLVEQEMDNVSV